MSHFTVWVCPTDNAWRLVGNFNADLSRNPREFTQLWYAQPTFGGIVLVALKAYWP